MRIGFKLALAFSLLLSLITPSAAAFWDCVAPEIDGAAGLSAIAALVSVGMIAYRRHIDR
jgi:hypothetical protein